MISDRIRKGFELVKFEHTIFALPFAYLGMLLAHRQWPPFKAFFLITLAMAGARTAGMTLNRLIDLQIDSKNPRTKNRPTVTGEFKISWAWGLTGVSLAVFLISSALLNPLCLKLSPIALILLTGYHYVKRFSFLCHWVLGSVLAIAPIGGWIGVTGSFEWAPVALSLAVLFWVAGFDILYSLQDAEFDRSEKLHSVPVRFGTRKALMISRACHIATIFFLSLFGFFHLQGILYWAGVAITAALLSAEHFLVRDGDLLHINTAFFTINGWIGVLLLIFTFLDIFR